METGREFSFVGLLSLAQLISWGALYYSFAIVSVPIERDLGWDKATVNGAWSIGLLFTGFGRLSGRNIPRPAGRPHHHARQYITWSGVPPPMVKYGASLHALRRVHRTWHRYVRVSLRSRICRADAAFSDDLHGSDQPTHLGRRTRSHYICSSRGLVSQLARTADNSANACDYLARGMLPNSRIGPVRAINDYGRTNGIAGRKGKHSGLKACTASSLVLGSPGDVYDSLHTCHRNRVSHHGRRS
jgi:hypothetical protein